MSSRNSWAPSRVCCAVKITSATRAAWSRPVGDEPAWKMTGRPCGLPGNGSGPRTEKYFPTKSISCTRSDRANRPDSLSPTMAPSPQLSHDVDELVAAVVALGGVGVGVKAGAAEHLGGRRVGRGDGVPAGAAAAGVVQ